MSDEPTKEELLECRRRQFIAELKPVRYPETPGEMALSVTYNGDHWREIRLTPEERLKVIRLLLGG